jgi:hypothetical protein
MDLAATLELEGRVWFRNALTAEALLALDGYSSLQGAPGERLGLIAPLREALEAGPSPLVRGLMAGARPVRAVAFDKSAESNWALGWHQDRVVVAASRCDAPGFINWTIKAGEWHVEPPIDVLEQMVFIRIHLDDADPGNGCMQVALGSHLFGKAPVDQTEAVVAQCRAEDCIARRGDVLIAKALILHRSSASTSARRRRTLRIDYRSAPLPAGLE